MGPARGGQVALLEEGLAQVVEGGGEVGRGAELRLVDDLGTPWHGRPNSLEAAVPPTEDWYREY